MTDADIGQLQSTQDWLQKRQAEDRALMAFHRQARGAYDRTATPQEKYRARYGIGGLSGNDPGPGRIDAVSTTQDWRDTVNADNGAWDDQDEEEDITLTESERHPHGCDCDECQHAWMAWADGQDEEEAS